MPTLRTMPSRHELSLFENVLLTTDGTVTDLIALHAGEPIRVRKLEQQVQAGSASRALLDCARDAPVMVRRILLTGEAKPFVHAESEFVVDRLPDGIREAMLHTDRPIGLLWREARLETFREIVEHSVAPCADAARHFGVDVSTPFVSRTYLVHHGGRPMGLITERWPLNAFR